MNSHIVPGLDLCCTDPVQHLITAGEDLEDLVHDLSDLSDVRSITIWSNMVQLVNTINTGHQMVREGREMCDKNVQEARSELCATERTHQKYCWLTGGMGGHSTPPPAITRYNSDNKPTG